MCFDVGTLTAVMPCVASLWTVRWILPQPCGQHKERFRPRLRCTHRKHLPERLARNLVAVDRALMQRPGEAGLCAQRAMKLKLQHPCEKVAHVRDIKRNVPLCPRIEGVGIEAGYGRHHTLVLELQFPPVIDVVSRPHTTGEYIPAPFVDEQAERQERDLVERQRQLLVDRGLGILFDPSQQTLGLQVTRRHRQHDGVADRLMEAIIRADHLLRGSTLRCRLT